MLANCSKLLTMLGSEGLLSESDKAVLVGFFKQFQVRHDLVLSKDVQRPESFIGHSNRAGLGSDRLVLKKQNLETEGRKKEIKRK